MITHRAFALAALLPCGCSLVNPLDDLAPALPATGGAGQGGAGGESALARCGDGVMDEGEACDDGDESASCNADCSEAKCGDGKHNAAAGESCDQGGATESCDGDCSPVACGDAIRNLFAGEACDDGNEVAGDACSPGCAVTPFDVQSDAALYFANARPDVTVIAQDRFLVAWRRDFPAEEVAYAVYDASGRTEAATEVASAPGESIAYARAIANGDGRVLVAWVSVGGDVRYRFLAPDLVPQTTSPQDIAAADVGALQSLALGVSGGGAFCASWSTSSPEAVVRCFDAGGSIADAGGTLGMVVDGDEPASSVWGRPSGFFAAWVDTNELLQALELDDEGQPATGDPALLSTLGGSWPSGATDLADGAFWAASSRELTVASQTFARVFVRAFDASAQPLGTETKVSLAHDADEIAPELVTSDEGALLVVWMAVTPELDCAVRARYAEPAGGWHDPFDVAPLEPGVCHAFPRAAVTAAGDVMITWVSDSSGADAAVRAAIYPGLL